jgi:hypothetical protein
MNNLISVYQNRHPLLQAIRGWIGAISVPLSLFMVSRVGTYALA